MSTINGKISGKYLVSVVSPDGSERFPLGEEYRPNLVLNSGLNMLFAIGQANGGFGGVFTYCRIGASNTAVAVGQTTLFNQLKSTNTYLTTTGACGSSSDTGVGTRTHKRTFQFVAETVNTNYNEVGFSNLGGAGDNLFSRVVFPSTVTVNTGEILRVVYQLTVGIAQTLTASNVTLSGGGFDGTGTVKVVGTFENLFGTISSTGAETVNYAPRLLGNTSTGYTSWLLTNSSYPGANTALTPAYAGISAADSGSNAGTGTYIADAYYKDITYVFPANIPADSVSNIRMIGIGNASNGPVWLLNAAQSKANTQTLTLVNRVAWGRP